jgi:hypothetical protein
MHTCAEKPYHHAAILVKRANHSRSTEGPRAPAGFLGLTEQRAEGDYMVFVAHVCI